MVSSSENKASGKRSFSSKYERGDKEGMKVAKTFSAPPQSIHIIPGYNYRKIIPEKVNMFAEMYLNDIDVPPIFVAINDETGKLELVDGEHRLRAALLAKLEQISMIEFRGTMDERFAAAIRFNQGSSDTETDRARAFHRMRERGWSNARIARETGMSEGTVANMLLIAASGKKVMDMIEQGSVAPTTVFNLARSIGPDKVLQVLINAKTRQQNAAEKKENKKSKSRKISNRITEKQIVKTIPKKDDLHTLLTMYLNCLPKFEVVKNHNTPANAKHDDEDITLRCPVKVWREIQMIHGMTVEFLNKK